MSRLKKFKQFINESFDGYEVLNDEYFIKRIPFFKTFKNKSYDNEVVFNFYKNWQGDNAAILNLGKGNGFVKFSYFSVESKFNYTTIRMRDFEKEAKLGLSKPLFKTEHQFIYSTDINLDLPKDVNVEDIPNQIASSILMKIVQEELKFKDSFETEDGEPFPKDKLDNIINSINKNLFEIEDILGKMGLSFF